MSDGSNPAALSPDWSKWRIGQRVWCVDVSHLGSPQGEILPTLGEIYTIRALTTTLSDYAGIMREYPACQLVEIVNPPLSYFFQAPIEAAWLLRRFRPLNEEHSKLFASWVRTAPSDLIDADSRDAAREIKRAVESAKAVS